VQQSRLVRLLSSALFWKILLSSLGVVLVLGLGLYRAVQAHEEIETQFKRLVEHDLRLEDDAEVLLRLTSDLETGKRGFLLTGDRSFLTPYQKARADLDVVLGEAQNTAEPGKEDARVAEFGRAVHDWIETISEPQIHQRELNMAVDAEKTNEGKARTDEMRAICTELRNDAREAADEREQKAFASAKASRQLTSGVLILAIIIALGSGIWIARDLAGATAQLEEALAATGRLEPLPRLPDRKDELGAVGRSLVKMAALLYEKDSSLRNTLAERERTLVELTRANEALAMRDAAARAYAEFVRELKTLDVQALSTTGLKGLVRLAAGHVGVVYLLDSADRLVPMHAETPDGGIVEHRSFGVDGLPKNVMDRREPILISGNLGEMPPKLDLGIASASLRWILGQPVAVGNEAAGALVIGGLEPLAEERVEQVRDAARQLAVGLHNAWTHDRLREKSIMLAEQGETLARANKVKTEFLASMSHELRTPLSAILGFADLLVSSPKEQLSPRARESLDRIKRNGEHLLSLINDVLDLAKAEAGRLDVRLAPVSVGQLARACVAEVDSLRAGKDLQLRVDVPDAPIETQTDAQRVRQVLLNLLSNAIKFTEQGEVSLTLRASADEIRIAVSDTGRGISAAHIGQLFQEFHQLDGGDGKRYPGTGMGLALSRRLARALGGEIEVRSREREGSTFTLVLPRRELPAQGEPEAPSARVLS
jgi:signal transduction histidine kinase/CHASE3 domain sensor protein